MSTHRPFLPVVVLFALGILSERYVRVPFFAASMVTVASLTLGLLTLNRKKLSGIFIAVALVFLGFIFAKNYQQLSQDHVYHIAKYYRKSLVTLEGVVVSPIEKRSFFKKTKTVFALDVKRFKTRWGWKKKTGRVLVSVFSDRDVAYGDTLSLTGKLYKPFNFSDDSKFSYKEYLKARKIRLLLSVSKEGRLEVLKSGGGNAFLSYVLQVKGKLNAIFKNNLTPVESALMQALILGDRTDIPKHITELFVKTGTAHILAVSGFNVAIVASLFFLVLKALPIGRTGQYLVTIVLVIIYSFLTGSKPPVVRATVMFVVFMLSFLIEKETEPFNSLSFAAMILLMINPLNLFDIGFQLSFISVSAIILLYTKILKRFDTWQERPVVMFFIQLCAVSLAAWIGVAGLVAYYFHIITPVTILANFIIVPLISVITALGLGMLVLGFVPACALVFAACIKFMLNITVVFIYLMSQIPAAYIYVTNVSLCHTACYYIILSFLIAFPALIRLTKKFKYDTLNHMKKIFLLFFLAASFFFNTPAFAFWIWTPETNRWVNPKYDVKGTPEEQLSYAKGIHDSKDTKKAMIELEKLIKNYPKAKEAAEAQFFIGAYLEEDGRLYEAFKAYQKVVEKYPFSDRFSDVIEKQYKIGERLLEGEGKRNKFVATLVGGEYDVIDVFRNVIKNAPYGKYAASSQYKIGLYLSERGLYQEARDEFEKVINDYPGSEWIKAAQYQIALVDAKRSTPAQYDQKVTQVAIEELKEFTKTYPDAELSQKAHAHINDLREKEAENNFLVGRFYEKQKKYDSAKVYYKAVIKDFESSSWAPKAQERLREMEKKVQ